MGAVLAFPWPHRYVLARGTAESRPWAIGLLTSRPKFAESSVGILTPKYGSARILSWFKRIAESHAAVMAVMLSLRVDSPNAVRDDNEFAYGNLRVFLSFSRANPYLDGHRAGGG